MIMQVFAVYDKAVQAFTQPFFVRHRGEALRSFTDACNDEKSNFYRHATDYTLMWLGEWDDSSGVFSTTDPARIVGAYECLADEPFRADNRAGPEGNGGLRPVS